VTGRPLLTTPPRLQHQAFADLQRRRLAAQPWLGVAGLLLAAAVFFALALGTGSTRTSLLVLGPLSTFALPAVAMVAFWWNDWPGSRLTKPWTGLVDTLLVAAAGLRNPGGPVAGPDFGSALIAVGVWQAVFFIALRGWPVNTINRRPHRLLAGNALVVGLGALTYLVLRNLAHWQPDAIGAACGCIISAALIVSRLRRQRPLDPGHPRRVAYHRRSQLHRSRHHPPRRHRTPLALRPPGSQPGRRNSGWPVVVIRAGKPRSVREKI
jgi:hypothetical protein